MTEDTIELRRLYGDDGEIPDSIGVDYDGLGGVHICVLAMLAPADATDEQVKAALAKRFPSTHYTHSHDCCGHYYRQTAKLLTTQHYVDEEGQKCRLVVVLRQSNQNV